MADDPKPFVLGETPLDHSGTLTLYGSMSERTFAREAARESAVEELKAALRETREAKALYRFLLWLNRKLERR